jgi:redox-sensitive bicupin YhaK (pirin superfamily)
MSTTPLLINRGLERLVLGRPTRDGDGVKLTRVLTTDLQQRLDPFLMLDQFGSDDPSDYGGGFPDHPHRGFETITYMIAGRMRHQDSAGHQGLLQNGGVQWMTAGKGIIHSEIPEQEAGVMEGFQLWLNLPAKDKLCSPWYRDIQSAEIPEVHATQGVRVRVIAGTFQGISGAVQRPTDAFPTDTQYLDIHFEQDGVLTQTLNPAYNAFIYTYRGNTEVMESTDQSQSVALHHMGILRNKGQQVQLRAQAGTKVLLIAGRPLNEPITQYGPFVMNTRAELMQAVEDFNNGLFTAAPFDGRLHVSQETP